MNPTDKLYFACFVLALVVSYAATPLFRKLALTFGILDHPHSEVKTHTKPTPYLGGVAVALGTAMALVAARAWTTFPTGTLRSLRGMLLGGSLILLLGLVDDIKHTGLGYRFKFVGQIVAALCLVSFDIRISFIHPFWVADILTIIWVVGITNAVNIIDIMDGLAAGIAVIASLGFLFISLPSEQIYVNFASSALAGGLLGFMPYNFSHRWKIFLGDTGSLFTGFMLAALSLGTAYTHVNNAGVFAPLLILGVPIYDTILVTILRLQKGLSPFLGSLDHYALRLEKHGFYREEILILSYALSLLLTFAAYEVTLVAFEYAMAIYAVVGALALVVGTWLARIRID
jgi:UDP-GlcNAc:undecaprenyl-phosphate/decaprenyl-phosphate GlcNAc-1-phosphate transferase